MRISSYGISQVAIILTAMLYGEFGESVELRYSVLFPNSEIKEFMLRSGPQTISIPDSGWVCEIQAENTTESDSGKQIQGKMVTLGCRTKGGTFNNFLECKEDTGPSYTSADVRRFTKRNVVLFDSAGNKKKYWEIKFWCQ